MNVRAAGALACVALSALACGYDYVDRRAATEGGAPAAGEAARAECHAGEPAADAAATTTKELLARPSAFAKKTLRVRGTLRTRGDAAELITQDGGLALDLAELPPWWIDACPGKVVDVDGTLAVAPAGAAPAAPVLRAVALVGASP